MWMHVVGGHHYGLGNHQFLVFCFETAIELQDSSTLSGGLTPLLQRLPEFLIFKGKNPKMF